MTVWGLSPLDDDDCIDFIYEVRAKGLLALERALEAARYRDSRPEQHAEGFAAAYIVVAIVTKDAEVVSAETLALKPNREHVEACKAVLRIIFDRGDEYMSRWFEMGDEVVGLKGQQFTLMAKVLGFDLEDAIVSGDLLTGKAPAEQAPGAGSWQTQRIANLQLLQTRDEMKDDFEADHKVDHMFACSTDAMAKEVMDALKEDFELEGPTFLPAESENPECWAVVASKHYPPNFENTWGYTLRMFDVAKKTGAEYDGWGAPITKRKRAWFGR